MKWNVKLAFNYNLEITSRNETPTTQIFIGDSRK